MKILIYQVDAFADKVFSGNPAAVCPLDKWLPTETMQAIAEENNLSETAFFLPNGNNYDIRWFTPKAEIGLAGHPTLATAHMIFTELEPDRRRVIFNTHLGDTLEVVLKDDILTMDFPAWQLTPAEGIDQLAFALGARPKTFLNARDGFAVFDRQSDVQALVPDMRKLCAMKYLGIIATAPGDNVDFVSRFFAPAHGIPEDPVTGSAHCELIPYWAKRLGKTELSSRQISQRGGHIYCSYSGDRVKIGGKAVTYMRGEIEI